MQFWSSEGTHSIRRTKQDILRTKSISRFGRKLNQVGTNTGEHLVCSHLNSYFLFVCCGFSGFFPSYYHAKINNKQTSLTENDNENW